MFGDGKMKTIQTLITDHLDIWTAADTEKKSGRGRSSGNAGSVYGIKKLRELILELAVRGKLVPQDENDEPARRLSENTNENLAARITPPPIFMAQP
jgi:type I restriction enzyme S subunit